jgi:transposase
VDDKSVLRLSLDAKARVNIGPFDRGGRNRALTETEDHDYNPKTVVTPYGIFLPELDELFLYFTSSKVTSDFIVDVLSDFWKSESWRFPEIKTLILNQDNGGENNSRRTQFMKRIVEFAHQYRLNIRLAYYPPYHSKYNPIERTWGILEKYWNGSILDEVETALKFAQNMTTHCPRKNRAAFFLLICRRSRVLVVIRLPDFFTCKTPGHGKASTL